MTLSELREEISIELEMMGSTVQEAVSLLNELSMRVPTVREKTAAGTKTFQEVVPGRIPPHPF